VDGRGALIIGPSGSGKSGLALSIIALGGQLVGDDQIDLIRTDDQVHMHHSPTIQNQIEARYFGLLHVPFVATARLNCVVDMGRKQPNRLPEHETVTIFEQNIPIFAGANVPNLASVLYVHLKQ